jgi:hypothetical protein
VRRLATTEQAQDTLHVFCFKAGLRGDADGAMPLFFHPLYHPDLVQRSAATPDYVLNQISEKPAGLGEIPDECGNFSLAESIERVCRFPLISPVGSGEGCHSPHDVADVVRDQ